MDFVDVDMHTRTLTLVKYTCPWLLGDRERHPVLSHKQREFFDFGEPRIHAPPCSSAVACMETSLRAEVTGVRILDKNTHFSV